MVMAILLLPEYTGTLLYFVLPLFSCYYCTNRCLVVGVLLFSCPAVHVSASVSAPATPASALLPLIVFSCCPAGPAVSSSLAPLLYPPLAPYLLPLQVLLLPPPASAQLHNYPSEPPCFVFVVLTAPQSSRYSCSASAASVSASTVSFSVTLRCCACCYLLTCTDRCPSWCHCRCLYVSGCTCARPVFPAPTCPTYALTLTPCACCHPRLCHSSPPTLQLLLLNCTGATTTSTLQVPSLDPILVSDTWLWLDELKSQFTIYIRFAME